MHAETLGKACALVCFLLLDKSFWAKSALEKRVYFTYISLREVRARTKGGYTPEGTLLANLLRFVLS